MRHRFAVALSLVAGAAFVVGAGDAQRATRASAPTRSVWDSVYTAEQATRGQTSYGQTCAKCHLESLGGADESPPLAGSAFLASWNGETLGILYERIRTSMPPKEPGTYDRQLIADVVAYLLKANGFPSGSVELPTDTVALKEIRLETTKP